MTLVRKFFIAILLLFLSIHPAAAVQLKLGRKNVIVYTGESVEIPITIINDGDKEERFMLYLFPSFDPNIRVELQKYRFELGPGEEGSTVAVFTATECGEEVSKIFTFTVKSLTVEENQVMDSISVSVVRKYQVCIYDFRLDKQVVYPEDNVTIEVSLLNPSSTLSLPFSIITAVKKDGEILQTFLDRIEAIEPKTRKTFSHTFSIKKYEKPGYYTVEVVLKDHLGRDITTKKTQFRVGVLNATENPSLLKIEKNVRYGLISQVVEIKVRNEGNVPTAPFTLTESIPLFIKPFFLPKVEPDSQEEKENRIIYSWYIEKIEPGEEVTITYEISVMGAVITLLAIGGLVAVAFLYVFSLRVVKRAKVKEGKIMVMLEVKNRTRKEVRNVIVRDFVPSIAKVVERFETLRPKLRKMRGGTELLWKIDVLRPKEERIITYYIKPTMEVRGKLKLPPAYLKIPVGKKEIKKVISKAVFVELK